MDDHVFNKFWVWGISCLAGTVSYIQTIDKDSLWRDHVLSYTGRLVTACFTGMTGYILSQILKSYNPTLHWGWEYLIVLVFAWRGVKGMDVLGDIVDRVLQAIRTGAPNSDK